MNRYDLLGKVVVVTGGTGYIGSAIVKRLLESRAIVVCGSTSEEKFSKMTTEKFNDPNLHFCLIDVTSAESVNLAIEETIKKFGRINGLVNCAGKNLKKPFLDTTDNDLQGILEVNLFGAMRMSRAVCKQMVTQDTGGVVVNICSVASFMALSEVTTYAMSKAALLAMTRQMAVERQLVKKGIRTIAVAPGVIPAEQNRAILQSGTRGKRFLLDTPMERFGEPSEIAEVVAFCLSDASSFMNGCCLNVDGGLMINGVSEAMEDKIAIADKPGLGGDASPAVGCNMATNATGSVDLVISTEEAAQMQKEATETAP